MKTNWLLWCIFLPFALAAQEIPIPEFPMGVGVNIHFVTGHEQDLDLIAAAGFHFIRMDFAWASIEQQKDQYRWSEYEELLANLEKRGIRAVFILDYSNPLYEKQVTSTNPLTHQSHETTASPQHPESIAAFARWAAAAAKHFHRRHVLWELWNEPNIDFWSPKPNVDQYTALALAASKAIREAEPEATIVGPATSGFPWEFLEAFFRSGILDYLDAVSVHPYRSPRQGPETATADYDKLRQLIERHAPERKRNKIPILSGEWGYSSWQRGVSLETQATFLTRQQLVNLLNDVPLSIWYDWKNDGTDPKENEHNFGTVDSELKPKPAYLAARTLTHELSGFRIARRLPLENPQDYMLVCTNSGGTQKLVGWTAGEPHTVQFGITGKAQGATRTLGDGTAFVPEFSAGECRLNLAPAPCFLNLRRAALK